jgi:hypothetical protein
MDTDGHRWTQMKTGMDLNRREQRGKGRTDFLQKGTKETKGKKRSLSSAGNI